MVTPFSIKGLIPKTEKRKKSDAIAEAKRILGMDIHQDDECDWTVDGSAPIELPDLPDLEL